jgi:SOS-response transcriptional repressor LexA
MPLRALLTPRQHEGYEFIRTYLAKYGYSPSVRDVQAGLGHKSTNATQGMLNLLVKKRLIRMDHGKARSIRLGNGEREKLLAKLASLPIEKLRHIVATCMD